jgi:hypothetical protein
MKPTLVETNIAQAAQECRRIQDLYKENPPPTFDVILAYMRTLIMLLSARKKMDPQTVSLVTRLGGMAMDGERIKQRAQALALQKAKFQFDAAEECLKRLPELKTISEDSALSDSEKVEAIRARLFGTEIAEAAK